MTLLVTFGLGTDVGDVLPAGSTSPAERGSDHLWFVEYQGLQFASYAQSFSVTTTVGYDPRYPAFYESVALSDGDISFDSTKVYSDLYAGIDRFSYTFAPGTFTATFGATDSAVWAATKYFSDSVTFTTSDIVYDLNHWMVDHFWNIDAIRFGTLYERLFTDTVDMDDPVFKTFVAAPFTDSVSLSEAVVKHPAKYFTHDYAAPDTFARVVTWDRLFSDSYAISESAFSLATAKVIVESVTFSDAHSYAMSRPFADSFGMNDSAGVGLYLTLLLRDDYQSGGYDGAEFNLFDLNGGDTSTARAERVVFSDVIDIIMDGTLPVNGLALNEAAIN